MNGLTLATGAEEPVGAAVPDGTTGTAGVVLLTKVGGAGITVGLDVTRGATGTVDATSTGEAEVTTGTTGAVVATSAGEVAIGVGTAVTGLVTVQGQSVIVRVVAWKREELAFRRFEVGGPGCEAFRIARSLEWSSVPGLPQSQRRLTKRARTRWRMGSRW